MESVNLERVGLKDKEARVYTSLLKEGPSLANQLAKKTNILRSSIYDYLDVLLDKGFVTYTIKSGKKYFQSVNPEKVLDKFEEQKRIQETALKEAIPLLNSIKGTGKKKVNVEVFEGKEGMKTAFSAILRDEPKEILVHGSSGASYKIMPFFMEHWHRQRVKQKIPLKIIYHNVLEARERLEKGPKPVLMDIKFQELTAISLIGTLVYNNKVLITIWDSEAPIAILIEGKEISETYRKEFGLLWKIAKR